MLVATTLLVSCGTSSVSKNKTRSTEVTKSSNSEELAEEIQDSEQNIMEDDMLEEEGLSSNEEELFDDFEIEEDFSNDGSEDQENVVDLEVGNDVELFESETVAPGEKVQVTALDFLAGQRGGTVVIKTSGVAEVTSRFNETTNQFVVEVQNSFLPNEFKRPYILKDFRAASFAAINAYQKEGSNTSRIVIQVKNNEKPILQKEGDTFIIIPKYAGGVLADGETPTFDPNFKESDETKSAILSARTLEEFLITNSKFYGKPVSIQLKDADIVDVIHFLSEQSGANLVVSSDVQGKITLKLRKIPWDQALVLIMKAKGLGYVRQGNILRVSTLQTLAREREERERIFEERKNNEPLRMQIVPISYADIGELSGQLSKFSTKGRGTILSDKRTNSLVITDTEDAIQQMMSLIENLDVPPKQVLIEGKIVSASESWDEGWGIDWESSGAFTPLPSQLKGGVDGSQLFLSQSASTALAGPSFGATGGIGLTIGTFKFLGDLTAQLQLLESKRKATVLSSPRVITVNNQSATITQSTSQPYNSGSIDSNTGVSQTNVSFQTFTLNMSVTPQITAQDSVILQISVSRSAPSGVTAESGAAGSNSSQANTQLVVENGQTAVVGGIFTENESSGRTDVPALSKVPVLGWLFRSERISESKNEMVIFLTPRILKSLGNQKKGLNSKRL